MASIGNVADRAKGLEPGVHALRFGGDRYRPLDRRVSIVAGVVTRLGDVRLDVLRGMVTITLATPGARVLLVNGDDQRELPTIPISVNIDTRKAGPWVIHATMPGYCEYQHGIDFGDGVATKTVRVELRRGCGP